MCVSVCLLLQMCACLRACVSVGVCTLLDVNTCAAISCVILCVLCLCLCVGPRPPPSPTVRIVRLHPEAPDGPCSGCDNDCQQASCDLLFDEAGVCVSACAPATRASFPAVNRAEPWLGARRRKVTQV